MLQPVALSHSGFRAPGLAQDGRGVVVGSQAAVLIISLDRLVSLLRLLSEERAFADLLPSLHIDEVQNPLGARGYLLRVSAADSRLLDRVAAAAALSASTLFVGAERHFVAYRDRRAPLGYDIVELSSERGDYVLYTATATQAYHRIAEVALPRLLSRLQLLPRPHPSGSPIDFDGEALWLLAPSGLLPRVLRFLWQRGVSAFAALPDPLPPLAEPAPAAARSPRPLPALIRLPKGAVVAAQLRLLLALPGVRALLPQSDHLAVELGYAHPLRLHTFERLFDKSQRHLFLATAAGRFAEALTLSATPFIPAERLIELRYGEPSATGESPPLAATDRAPAFGDGPLPLRLPLRLVPKRTKAEPPAATLVPWSQSQLLRRLLGVLPAPLFTELRAVCIDEGALLVGDSASLSGVPLGRLFYAAAPSVLVPFGMELAPRLRGDLLRSKLEGVNGRLVVFLPSAAADDRQLAPIAIAEHLFQPIGAAFISALRLGEDGIPLSMPPLSSDPTVVNDSLGLLFGLWGRSGPKAGAKEGSGDR